MYSKRLTSLFCAGITALFLGISNAEEPDEFPTGEQCPPHSEFDLALGSETGWQIYCTCNGGSRPNAAGSACECPGTSTFNGAGNCQCPPNQAWLGDNCGAGPTASGVGEIVPTNNLSLEFDSNGNPLAKSTTSAQCDKVLSDCNEEVLSKETQCLAGYEEIINGKVDAGRACFGNTTELIDQLPRHIVGNPNSWVEQIKDIFVDGTIVYKKCSATDVRPGGVCHEIFRYVALKQCRVGVPGRVSVRLPSLSNDIELGGIGTTLTGRIRTEFKDYPNNAGVDTICSGTLTKQYQQCRKTEEICRSNIPEGEKSAGEVRIGFVSTKQGFLEAVKRFKVFERRDKFGRLNLPQNLKSITQGQHETDHRYFQRLRFLAGWGLWSNITSLTHSEVEQIENVFKKYQNSIIKFNDKRLLRLAFNTQNTNVSDLDTIKVVEGKLVGAILRIAPKLEPFFRSQQWAGIHDLAYSRPMKEREQQLQKENRPIGPPRMER